jgi:hypothetical protein
LDVGAKDIDVYIGRDKQDVFDLRASAACKSQNND